MAIYHFSAQVISRSAGRSAVASAAYRSGQEITDERSGDVHDYTRKGAVEHVEIIAPDNAPEWAHDRSSLWNAVEGAEKRKDAQLAREVEVSLPHELSREQQIDLVRGFVREQFVARGMVADIAIHAPERDGVEQPHAHIMLTTRQIGPDGFGAKERSWNDRALLDEWRGAWADHANRALERAGHEERIDHRSLEDQRAEALEVAADKNRPESERQAAELRADDLDREPSPTISRAAFEMEMRGIRTEQGDRVREVIKRNEARKALREQLREVKAELVAVAKEIGAKAAEIARNASEAVKRVVARPKPALTEEQRVERMTAKELRAEIDRLRPQPVDETVRQRPEIRQITHDGMAVRGEAENARQRLTIAQRDVFDWERKHPTKKAAHDNGLWKSVEYISKKDGVALAERHKIAAEKRLSHHQRQEAALWDNARDEVQQAQKPVWERVARLENALRPKEQQERLAQMVREAEPPNTSPGSQYTGKIIKVDDQHVWQDHGRTAIKYDRATFGANVPKVGENIVVRYSQKSVSAEKIISRGYDRGL